MMRYLWLLALPLPLIAAPATNPGQAQEWGISVVGRASALAVLTNATHLSCNSSWSLALRSDGSLLAWGSNADGQTNAPSGTNYTHCYAGWRHGIACKTDGTIVEWGTPFGNTIAAWEAKRPPMSNIVMVSAGDNHSAALQSNGTLVIWGGTATTTNYSGVFTNVRMMSSQWYNMIALLTSGIVTNFGHLGKPGQYLAAPTTITNGRTIGTSRFASYAVNSNGVGFAWGMPETFGQYTMIAPATNLVSIGGGDDHTIVARADGRVFVWGDNSLGQTNVPVSVTNSAFVVSHLYHSQAIINAGDPPAPPAAPVAIIKSTSGGASIIGGNSSL